MNLRTRYISAPLWSQIQPLPLKAKHLIRVCKCRHTLTHADLCSLVLSQSPFLLLPLFPRPSLCSWTIPSSSLVQGLCVYCLLCQEHSFSTRYCMADWFLWSSFSLVSNFLSPALHFLPYNPILFYLWYLISKSNVLIGFLHVIHLLR